jgi:pyridinium-3,5-biscarboxylic acid mononucleotide sulfurtransferase
MVTDLQYNQLLKWFNEYNQIAVAFSGGIDSTYLLAVAKKALNNRVVALTIRTPYIPDWEIAEATAFCKAHNIKHCLVQAELIPEISNNPVNRCYLCKKHLFGLLKKEASLQGHELIIDGTNADDADAYRPGIAVLNELGIRSPLMETGITKQDIRRLSAALGLACAEKPANACLLTRFPYHYEIRSEELQRIEKAELYMASLGYDVCRVRNHGNIARIEIEKNRLSEFVIAQENGRLTGYFHKLGFDYITVDLEGYRSGSFDKHINQHGS